MNDFPVNHELAKKREIAFNKIDMEYRKALSSKYSKISIEKMINDKIIIHCYASDKELSKTELERKKTIDINEYAI